MFGFCVKNGKVVVAYLKGKSCIILCETFTSSLPGWGSSSLGSSRTLAAGRGWVFLEKLGKTHSSQLRVGFFWSRSFYFSFLEEDITFNSSDLDSSQADAVTNAQQRSSVLFGGAYLCLRSASSRCLFFLT